MPINYNKLIKELKPFPSLSLSRQNRAYRISIIGVILSVFLGSVSAYLAYKVKDSSIKIDKMDSLIGKIVEENTTLADIAHQDSVLMNQNTTSINKLESIIGELHKQYNTVTTNTQPKIKLADPVTTKLNDNIIDLKLFFTNSGSRNADNLEIEVYKIFEYPDTMIASIVFNGYNKKELSLTPGDSESAGVKLNYKTESDLNKWSIRLKLTYLDQLTKIPKSQTFYLKPVWQNFNISFMGYPPTAYKLKMDKAIKNLNRQ